MKNSKISIIMGTYNINKDNMIDACINSIISQDYTNWELIICDDGSTDGTWDELKKWEKRDKRIKLIRNEKNRSLAPTLNRCLTHCDGEFIARMDGDDVSACDRFTKQVEFLEKNPTVLFCGTEAVLFDEDGNWGYRTEEEIPSKSVFLYKCPFIHASLLARREMFELFQYDETNLALRGEDYDLFMRVYAKGYKGGNVKEGLYYIREGKDCYKRRKYRDRFREVRLKAIGFYRLKLYPQAIPFLFKPLIVGLIPQKILRKMRKEVVND